MSAFFMRTFFAAALVSPAESFAQSREPFQSDTPGALLRTDVAGSRQPEGLEPLGIRAGSFLVQPSATARVNVDSNVFNQSTNKQGDVFVVFEPAVRVSGTDGQASYVLKAEAALARFATLAGQDRATFGVDAHGQLAIAPKAALFARVAYDRKIEPRGSAGESLRVGSPATYNAFETQIGVRAEFGPVRTTTSASVAKRSYDTVVVGLGRRIDQSFRDQTSVAIATKAEFAINDSARLFAQGTYNWIDSINPADCCDRSSTGGLGLVGLRADVSNLVTAEVALGYQVRNYESRKFKDFKALAYKAKVDWYPTPLMSLSLATDRSIVGSGIVDVAGVIVHNTQFQLHYEVRRNLNLVMTLARNDEDYREIGVSARSNLFGLEARYVFNANILGGAFGRMRGRDSSDLLIVDGGSSVEGGLWLRYTM